MTTYAPRLYIIQLANGGTCHIIANRCRLQRRSGLCDLYRNGVHILHLRGVVSFTRETIEE